MTPPLGPARAGCTSRRSAAQSGWGADRKLRATSTSPERQARSPPEACLADVGWEPIEREPAPPRRRRQAPPPRGVLAGARDQCGVALQPIGDGPRRDSAPPRDQRLRESRDTGVVGIARRANAGEDIAAKRVLGQGQTPCRCGSVRCAHLGTRRSEAPPHLEGEPHAGLQGCEGTIVVLGGPQRLTAAWTLAHKRLQGLGLGGGGPFCSRSLKKNGTTVYKR
jgi:hypothetical protein